MLFNGALVAIVEAAHHHQALGEDSAFGYQNVEVSIFILIVNSHSVSVNVAFTGLKEGKAVK